MGVTVERSLGVAVLGLVPGEVPDDQSLVARGGEEHVGAVFFVSRLLNRQEGAKSSSYFSMEVAKLVTQPFCSRHHRQYLSNRHRTQRRVPGFQFAPTSTANDAGER